MKMSHEKFLTPDNHAIAVDDCDIKAIVIMKILNWLANPYGFRC